MDASSKTYSALRQSQKVFLVDCAHCGASNEPHKIECPIKETHEREMEDLGRGAYDGGPTIDLNRLFPNGF